MNKGKLVQKMVQVQGKNKTFMRKQWVRILPDGTEVPASAPSKGEKTDKKADEKQKADTVFALLGEYTDPYHEFSTLKETKYKEFTEQAIKILGPNNLLLTTFDSDYTRRQNAHTMYTECKKVIHNYYQREVQQDIQGHIESQKQLINNPEYDKKLYAHTLSILRRNQGNYQTNIEDFLNHPSKPYTSSDLRGLLGKMFGEKWGIEGVKISKAFYNKMLKELRKADSMLDEYTDKKKDDFIAQILADGLFLDDSPVVDTAKLDELQAEYDRLSVEIKEARAKMVQAIDVAEKEKWKKEFYRYQNLRKVVRNKIKAEKEGKTVEVEKKSKKEKQVIADRLLKLSDKELYTQALINKYRWERIKDDPVEDMIRCRLAVAQDASNSKAEVLKYTQMLNKHTFLKQYTPHINNIIKDRLSSFSVPVDLDGCFPHLSMRALITIEEMTKKIPFLPLCLNSIKLSGLGHNVFANCNVFGEIKFGKKYYAHTLVDKHKGGTTSNTENSIEIEIRNREAIQLRYHPQGTEYKEDGVDPILVHEIGHALDFFMTRRSTKGPWTSTYSKEHMSDFMERETYKNLKGDKVYKKNKKNDLSEYAMKNNSEFFAEAFTELYCSSNPRAVATEVGNLLKMYLQDTTLLMEDKIGEIPALAKINREKSTREQVDKALQVEKAEQQKFKDVFEPVDGFFGRLYSYTEGDKSFMFQVTDTQGSDDPRLGVGCLLSGDDVVFTNGRLSQALNYVGVVK